MAKIKCGEVTGVKVHVCNRSEAGKFAIFLTTAGNRQTLIEPSEAKSLAKVLDDAAQKAKILDGAMQ